MQRRFIGLFLEGRWAVPWPVAVYLLDQLEIEDGSRIAPVLLCAGCIAA